MSLHYRLGISVYTDNIVSPHIFFYSTRDSGIKLLLELNVVIPIYTWGLLEFISLVEDVSDTNLLEYDTNSAHVSIGAQDCRISSHFDQSEIIFPTSDLMEVLTDKQKFISGFSKNLLYHRLEMALNAIKKTPRKNNHNWYYSILDDGYYYSFLLSEEQLSSLNIELYLQKLNADDKCFEWTDGDD